MNQVTKFLLRPAKEKCDPLGNYYLYQCHLYICHLLNTLYTLRIIFLHPDYPYYRQIFFDETSSKRDLHHFTVLLYTNPKYFQ